MLKKVTITKVFKDEKNKDGIPYAYKNGKNAGKNFTRVSIQTAETENEYYSNNCMTTDAVYKVEAGQTLILDLTEDNGFKNFRFPNKQALEVFNQFNPQQ